MTLVTKEHDLSKCLSFIVLMQFVDAPRTVQVQIDSPVFELKPLAIGLTLRG